MLARFAAALALASAAAGPAAAAEYYLEGPAIPAKTAANDMHTSAADAGIESRVVRRYLDAQGWRYLLVADGYADENSARNAANTLAIAVHGPVTVFALDGKEAHQVAVIQAAAAEPAPAPDKLVASDAEAQAIVERAVAALGGVGGGNDIVAAAKTVDFEYERDFEGGLSAKHVYVRRGADQALQVRVVKGDGVDSEIRLVGGTAWLRTGREGPFAAQDPERASELLEQASPTGIFPLILVFADAADKRGEFDQLARHGTSEVDGDACDVLQFLGDRTSGPMTLEISRATGLVRRVSFEGGDLVHQFDDYAPIAKGLVVPKRVRTWKEGKLAETDVVSSLALDQPVADAMLAAPDSP